MPTEKLVLTFPPERVKEPTVSRLVREYDLEVNIMKAAITPDEQGHMVVELSGEADQLASAKGYLDARGVLWEPLVSEVRRIEENCTHCTACVAVCPTQALAVEDRRTMRVAFAPEKCIACRLCIPVCGYRAMEIQL